MLACLLPLAAAAEPRVLGWLEWAWLEPGHVRIKSKLDTGARTSSLDARDLELFKRDARQWVRFRIPLASRPDDSDHGEDLVIEKPLVGAVEVKEHEGPGQQRHVVNIDLCLGGYTFTTPVTLVDRRRFNYPLLLGRVALQGRVIVDPAAKFSTRRLCRAPKPATP